MSSSSSGEDLYLMHHYIPIAWKKCLVLNPGLFLWKHQHLSADLCRNGALNKTIQITIIHLNHYQSKEGNIQNGKSASTCKSKGVSRKAVYPPSIHDTISRTPWTTIINIQYQLTVFSLSFLLKLNRFRVSWGISVYSLPAGELQFHTWNLALSSKTACDLLLQGPTIFVFFQYYSFSHPEISMIQYCVCSVIFNLSC